MKTLKFYLSTIAAIALFVGLAACAPAATPEPTPTVIPPTATPIPLVTAGDSEHTVMVGDLERSYLLHIPPNLETSTPVAVVFMFHGSTRSAIQFLPFGFKELSDEKGFVIVRPDGTSSSLSYPLELSWNAGTCCDDPVINNIDEAAFIREILSDLESIVTVDTKHVYGHGYSNGGMHVYRLACEMSDTFAAVASYAGSLVYTPCQPQGPVSILDIHGNKDTTVPFAGGGATLDVPDGFPPVVEAIKTWAQVNGCAESSQIETEDDNISHTAYTGCDDASSVEFILLEEQGHDYPSITVLPMAEVIWSFFDAHPKP